MKERPDPGKYESIRHGGSAAAKVHLMCIRSSAYHWHYDYELIAVLKGRIEVFYGLYGPEPQKLSAGGLILINPKEMHSLRGVEPDNTCLCIQFSPELFEPVPAGMTYHFYLNSDSREYVPAFSHEHYMRLAAGLGLACRSGRADAALRKKAMLYLFLADLIFGVQYELRSAPAGNEKNMELVQAVGTFIDANLMTENLPECVCRNFGVSEKGMYLLLKQTIGLSLKEMIDTARIERACALLQNDRNSLQFISDSCGYSGETTFYRRFKAAMGITPGEYRKGAVIDVVSREIQDYLSFSESEADLLLRSFAGEEEGRCE